MRRDDKRFMCRYSYGLLRTAAPGAKQVGRETVKRSAELLQISELEEANGRFQHDKDWQSKDWQSKNWQNNLADFIAPVVRTRVARILSRHSRVDSRHPTIWDAEEVTQDVMAMLFADGGRALRGWDRGRGLSFLNFVGLITERTAARIIQVRNRNARCIGPELGATEEDSLRDSKPGPESALAAREYSRFLIARIRETLSSRGGKLFDLLLIEARPIEEVCELTGHSREAVYAWRSRLGRLVRRIAREVELEGPNRAGDCLEVSIEEVSS